MTTWHQIWHNGGMLFNGSAMTFTENDALYHVRNQGYTNAEIEEHMHCVTVDIDANGHHSNERKFF